MITIKDIQLAANAEAVKTNDFEISDLIISAPPLYAKVSKNEDHEVTEIIIWDGYDNEIQIEPLKVERFNLKSELMRHESKGKILNAIELLQIEIDMLNDNMRMLSGNHLNLFRKYEAKLRNVINKKLNLIESWKKL